MGKLPPDDIIIRLRDACNGHPNALIPWPHRLLHDAIAEIWRLRKEKEPAPGDGAGPIDTLARKGR